MTLATRTWSALGAALLFASCATTAPAVVATATLAPTTAAGTAGLRPQGQVRFTQRGDAPVQVEARITGLRPNAEHGFHIHAVPNCGGDGTATGAHFNPDNLPHAHPSRRDRHAGAMFNLRTDAQGVGVLRQDVDLISLAPGRFGVVGMPVIVHLNPDDYQSQPLGNAGPRIACGLIVSN